MQACFSVAFVLSGYPEVRSSGCNTTRKAAISTCMRQFFRQHRRLSLGIVLITLLVAAQLWKFERQKDSDRNRPQDVVKMFVDAVQIGDFETAATYWRTGDIRNVEANSHMTFKDFCTHCFKCDAYKLTPMGKDKRSYVVGFNGKTDGKDKAFALFLQRPNGRWRIVMERFIPESEFVPDNQ
jgi:hypothetical protein